MLKFTQLQAIAQDREQALTVASVTTALAGLWLVYSYGSVDKRRHGSRKLPQPASTLPMLGNTLDAMKAQRFRMYDWLTEQSELHDGPWLFTIINRSPTIVATSPEIFEDVLKTQFDVFPKGEQARNVLTDLFGRGILPVDGDDWYFQRKTASHLFSLQIMNDVMHEVVSEKLREFCKVLTVYATTTTANGELQAVGMKSLLSHFTSDVFGKIGFGVELNCLQTGLERGADATGDGNAFIDAFSQCARIIQVRLTQPQWLWKLKRFFNIGEEKLNRECVKIVNDLMYNIISQSFEKKRQQQQDPAKNGSATKKPSKTKDLISLFLESKIQRPGTKDKQSVRRADMQLIRDTVVNFIFAGKDTTSQSMAYFILMMNRYPEIADKIRAELKQKLGMDAASSKIPSMEELKQLTYLEAVVRENLRLNPPVPVSGRTACADTVLCDGTFVAKGTRIALATYAQGRMKSIWGEDAAEFNPDRWIDPTTGNLISVSAYKFSTFFAGPRTCLGLNFALMEMKMTLAVLLSKFELKTVEDPWTMTYEPALVMTVKGPLKVHVHRITC
uniref:Cytochrome P450 n=1 Tax=Globisporangium ultimum (strain ATCC 200006 / CBS 805.95 / DAOM BR144) TaxID=431595 RepID=K3WS28_GLOUD